MLRNIFTKLKEHWAMLAILGLALLVRLYALWQTPQVGYVIDEAEYYQIASILADGRGWSFYNDSTWIRPPLYPIFLALTFKIFGLNLVIVRLIQIVLSVTTVCLLTLLGTRWLGRRAGLIAGLLAAITWPFAVLSTLMLSETLFLFLFVATISLLTYTINSPRIWQWLLGGLGLGLAALTRGQVLTFMPFVGLWLWWAIGWRKAGVAFSLVVIAFLITIAPWSFRNYELYGRPFIDTTGGYNFYLGAMHGRKGALVSDTLLKIANHAERENLGYQKGLAVLASNPLGFVLKGFGEFIDFWDINFGGDERLASGYTKGVISPAWLIPDQLLGDTLYFIIGLLGLLGLPLLPTKAKNLRNFIFIWMFYNVVLAIVFFAVSRFRLPVYFFLGLPAAYVIAYPQLIWQDLKTAFTKKQSKALVVILPFLFFIIVMPSYSIDQTVIGVQAWLNQQNVVQGNQLRLQGRYNEALNFYQKADQTIADTQIAIAITEGLQKKYEAATNRLKQTSRDIAQTHLVLGWLYLQQGQEDYAHGEFRTRQIALDTTSDAWAWNHLPTTPLPNNRLTIGEFDWGYVSGFHIYEKENPQAAYFRWTEGQTIPRLRFPLAPQSNKPSQLELRLSGYRPDSLNPPIVKIKVNGQPIGQIQTNRTWQTYTLDLPPTSATELIIELECSSTFVPSALSRRELGVMLEWIALK